VTHAERRAALEEVAAEVRSCTRCRLARTRTNAVPGEGNPSTEVMFVGEGPGFNEDRQGRPFVGRAGDLLVRLLASIGWRREDVFITNVVKCRPPDNRDPQPDEIAACAPYLRRQLEVLDPALVVTLGRYSLGTFMPGSRIGQVHGTARPVDPDTGGRAALALAMYHPAAALRTPAVERESFQDIARVPTTLVESRRRRAEHDALAVVVQVAEPAPVAEPPASPHAGYDARSSNVPVPSLAGAPAGQNGEPATLSAAESYEPASSPPANEIRSLVGADSVPPVVAPATPPPPEPPPDTDQMTLF
jgi:DNA polymerase